VVNPRGGTLVNWNNKPARDFPASDNQWSYGPVFRSQMLQSGLDRRRRHTLASVVAAMNRAAATDLRVTRVWPVVAEVLGRGLPTPVPAPLGRMVQLLNQYRAAGAPRLDRDLDGAVDHPGAAIVDAAWPRLEDAVLGPVLGPQLDDLDGLVGRDAGPASDFTDGRFWYVHKDLRTLLGEPVRGRFRNRYCGRGSLGACKAALIGALEAAGEELAAAQGPNPDAWRADAAAERIDFTPGVLPTTIRYTNRPSGIQQVLFFDGHRPRRR
jgi:hypothetical protein